MLFKKLSVIFLLLIAINVASSQSFVQIVFSQTTNDGANVDMSNYSSGIYFINIIKLQGTTITERIVEE